MRMGLSVPRMCNPENTRVLTNSRGALPFDRYLDDSKWFFCPIRIQTPDAHILINVLRCECLDWDCTIAPTTAPTGAPRNDRIEVVFGDWLRYEATEMAQLPSHLGSNHFGEPIIRANALRPQLYRLAAD
jgi:hypothetical protein